MQSVARLAAGPTSGLQRLRDAAQAIVDQYPEGAEKSYDPSNYGDVYTQGCDETGLWIARKLREALAAAPEAKPAPTDAVRAELEALIAFDETHYDSALHHEIRRRLAALPPAAKVEPRPDESAAATSDSAKWDKMASERDVLRVER